MAHTLCCANHKGGQLKTTVAINLAAGFARAGWRTLLVDVDAQANASEMFGHDEPEFDLYSLLHEDVPIDKVIQTGVRDNLDLLPSSLWVARLDTSLMQQYHRELRLRRALAPLQNDYDTIVLDLPPTLGQLVITALAACDSYIIPSTATRWGIRGLRNFLDWAEELRRADVLTAELLGVLVTQLERTTTISRDVLAEVEASGLPNFGTTIPKRTVAERLAGEHLVLGDDGYDDSLTEAFGQLCIEAMRRIREVEERKGRHRG